MITITITQNTFGFHVAIVSDDRQQFEQAIDSFKLIIPKRNRRFDEIGRVWFVDKRAEPKMRRWLESVSGSETQTFELEPPESTPDEAA